MLETNTAPGKCSIPRVIWQTLTLVGRLELARIGISSIIGAQNPFNGQGQGDL